MLMSLGMVDLKWRGYGEYHLRFTFDLRSVLSVLALPERSSDASAANQAGSLKAASIHFHRSRENEELY